MSKMPNASQPAFVEKRAGKSQLLGTKGCSCKRSQCIKNYCDCYQSMIICSTQCKCVGCRNVVERSTASLVPVKSSYIAKRERAAAMTAKVAAAAVKAGVVKPQTVQPLPFLDSGYLTTTIHTANPIALKPMPIQQTALTRQVSPAQMMVMPHAQQATKPVKVLPKQRPKLFRYFSNSVNNGLLQCLIHQAEDAEENALNGIQVGDVVLQEFFRGFNLICNMMFEE